MKKKTLVIITVLCCLCLVACGTKTKKESRNLVEKPYVERKFLLGTYVQFTIYDKGKKDTLKLAFDLVKKLGDDIDVNDKAHESEIDKVNENAGIKPVVIDPDIYRLVKKAVYYSKISDGNFDLSIGTITQLWHIGFDDARKPSQEEINQALKYVDYRKVVLDDAKHSVYLKEKGMLLDLGAIAKGFITDEVVSLLKKQKVTTAIVDLGGNVYVMGNSPRGIDTPWTVGIQDPNKARNQIVGTIPGSNHSFVTSGIYERYLVVDGVTYHHLMNPKTGYPFQNDIAGVTICSKYSIDGDGLSTTIFGMGLKEGTAFIERLKDTEAIFITKEDKIYKTTGVADTFEINKDSGYILAEDGEK